MVYVRRGVSDGMDVADENGRSRLILASAESRDGMAWRRHDDGVGIDASREGWDSEMIEYAHVFDVEGEHYMLDNGNGYCRTGVGLAVLGR